MSGLDTCPTLYSAYIRAEATYLSSLHASNLGWWICTCKYYGWFENCPELCFECFIKNITSITLCNKILSMYIFLKSHKRSLLLPSCLRNNSEDSMGDVMGEKYIVMKKLVWTPKFCGYHLGRIRSVSDSLSILTQERRNSAHFKQSMLCHIAHEAIHTL